MDSDIDNVIKMLDALTENEVSRIKVNVEDTITGDGTNIAPGSYKKEYHHGRCDVGSPWARGEAFDVLE